MKAGLIFTAMKAGLISTVMKAGLISTNNESRPYFHKQWKQALFPQTIIAGLISTNNNSRPYFHSDESRPYFHSNERSYFHKQWMQALFSQTDIISQCPLVMYPTHSSGQYLGQDLVEFIAQNKIFARATSDSIPMCILRLNTHV